MFDFIRDQIFRRKKNKSSTPDYFQQLTQRAMIITAIAPSHPGRAYYRATHWFAICEQPILLPEDTLVYVKETKGIILIVEPFCCNIADGVVPLTEEQKAIHKENALTGEGLTGLLF
jgi:hypothetical protein